MAYSQDSDLTNDIITAKELIDLTDDENGTTVNYSRVAQARKKIDDLLDASLRVGGYTLPLAATPAIVNNISIDGTVYFLWERKKKHSMPEGMKDKKKAIDALLRKIETSPNFLGVTDSTKPPVGGGSYKTNKTSDDRVFPKEKLDTY
jgi:phage gp36-like protein